MPESLPGAYGNKSAYITMELKSKAVSKTDGAKYKKQFAPFDDEPFQEWTEIQRDVWEVWTQSSNT